MPQSINAYFEEEGRPTPSVLPLLGGVKLFRGDVWQKRKSFTDKKLQELSLWRVLEVPCISYPERLQERYTKAVTWIMDYFDHVQRSGDIAIFFLMRLAVAHLVSKMFGNLTFKNSCVAWKCKLNCKISFWVKGLEKFHPWYGIMFTDVREILKAVIKRFQ